MGNIVKETNKIDNIFDIYYYWFLFWWGGNQYIDTAGEIEMGSEVLILSEEIL